MKTICVVLAALALGCGGKKKSASDAPAPGFRLADFHTQPLAPTQFTFKGKALSIDLPAFCAKHLELSESYANWNSSMEAPSVTVMTPELPTTMDMAVQGEEIFKKTILAKETLPDGFLVVSGEPDGGYLHLGQYKTIAGVQFSCEIQQRAAIPDLAAAEAWMRRVCASLRAQ